MRVDMRKRRPKTQPSEPARTTLTEHKGKPAFILAADDHVRNGAPECRTDNYVEAIFKKLEFRNTIAKEYNIPILHAGDIGDKSYFVKDGNGWTSTIYNRHIEAMGSTTILCVAGNHDLPGHDIENINQSALGALIKSEDAELLDEIPTCINGIDTYGASWDCEIPKPTNHSNTNILVIHKMIINNLPLWPGQEAPKAQDILKQNPDYDLIVSGDNHQAFTSEYKQRLLVNCGSMMRSTTKQFDHKPCFFLYYPESNSVEKVFYPTDPPEEVISLEHIKQKDNTNKRVEKYTNLVNTADLSELKTFRENSEIFISSAKLSDNIIKMIQGFVNHEEPKKFEAKK